MALDGVTAIQDRAGSFTVNETILAMPRHCEDHCADARLSRSWRGVRSAHPVACERLSNRLSLLPCQPGSSASRNHSMLVESGYRLPWQGRFRRTFCSVARRGRQQQTALVDFRSRRSFFTRDGRGHLGRNRGDGRCRPHGGVGVLASAKDGSSLRSRIAALARRSNLTGRINPTGTGVATTSSAAAAAAMTPQSLLLQNPLISDRGVKGGLQLAVQTTEVVAKVTEKIALGHVHASRAGGATAARCLGAGDRAALGRGQTAGRTTIIYARHAHAA